MKRILAIFFISFLILNTFGTIGYYYFNRSNIRASMKSLMKSNIPKDKIEVLKIAKNSKYFQRIHNKEFRYRGKMYDIIREVVLKEYTKYYCINDEKEEQLMKSYSKFFEDSSDGMTTVKYSGKIFKNFFVPFYLEKDNPIMIRNLNNRKYFTTIDKCINCYYDVEIPPPKILM